VPWEETWTTGRAVVQGYRSMARPTRRWHDSTRSPDAAPGVGAGRVAGPETVRRDTATPRAQMAVGLPGLLTHLEATTAACTRLRLLARRRLRVEGGAFPCRIFDAPPSRRDRTGARSGVDRSSRGAAADAPDGGVLSLCEPEDGWKGPGFGAVERRASCPGMRGLLRDSIASRCLGLGGQRTRLRRRPANSG
jgi:hypothetical protein